MKTLRNVARHFHWLGYSGLVLVALVGFLSYKYEDFKEDFPRLITWQLKTYQWINHPSSRNEDQKRVTPIEIDDKTFYDFLGNQTRNEFTDRVYLAQLVDAATDAGAGVIALDINLDASHAAANKDEAPALSPDDQKLFDAILRAQQAHIPVVLTFGFRPDKQPIPQVFDDVPVYEGTGISYQFPEDESPARPFYVPRFGFDHPGDDYRKVPLAIVGKDERGEAVEYYSFALQIVDAYEQKRPGKARQNVKNTLARQLAEHEFVYTSFLPVAEFAQPKRSDSGKPEGALLAIDVVCGPAPDPDKRKWETARCAPPGTDRLNAVKGLLKDHIVLIGGNRHGNRGETGEEDYLDDRQSPVGHLRGMYMQANYVEGLLDNRILYKVSPLTAAIVDVILALGVLWLVHRLKGAVRAGVVIAMFFVPVAIAYVAAATMHVCIDFVFPLVLLFLHPALESYIHLFLHRHEEAAHEKAH
jgi:CHASE2 domain-containing sensor protein